jgi:hypothetical protein
MRLTFDPAGGAAALPLEAQREATRLFGQLLLAVAKSPVEHPTNEYRKNHAVA